MYISNSLNRPIRAQPNGLNIKTKTVEKPMKTTNPPVVPATLATAKTIFTRGTDAFGTDELRLALGIELSSVPPLPFSEAELKRARELGQYLILQAGAAKDGKLLTMKKFHDQFSNELGDGKLLYDTDWYAKEDFYTKDTPRPGWALVSRKVIPGSESSDYIVQTQAIADYLRKEVYKDEELPEAYAVAIEEFESRKDELEKLRGNDWEKCAKELAELKLNQWFREKPSEVLYGLVVQHQVNNERLLPDMHTWTNQRSSDGRLVLIGVCASDGVYVGDGGPGRSRSGLGVRFFRSAVPNLES